MWLYSGANDPMRTSPLCLSDEAFETQMKRITQVHNILRRDGPRQTSWSQPDSHGVEETATNLSFQDESSENEEGGKPGKRRKVSGLVDSDEAEEIESFPPSVQARRRRRRDEGATGTDVEQSSKRSRQAPA